MRVTGAEMVIAALLAHGVDTVFGIPGGQALALYDALARKRGAITHVLCAHEQGACHAADGYARASGKTGVVFATSGPGATNLVTGIACAYMDSVPLVAVTVNVDRRQLGTDGFQEIDIFGVTTPITKHNFIVKDITDLDTTMRAAFRIARSGCQGPVLVDISRDVLAASAEYAPAPPAPLPEPPLDTRALDAMADALHASKRPAILAGGGMVASGARDALLALARKLQAPVAATLMGLGAALASEPLFTGLAGMHGTAASREALRGCDTLLAVGARFSDRVTGEPGAFAKGKRILHIDIDDAQIDKNVPAAIGACADAKAALTYLNSIIKAEERAPWLAVSPAKPAKPALTPEYALQTLARLLENEDAIVATDVGQHQIWAARALGARNERGFLTSGGLGAMGFGLPAVLGAKAALPSRRAVLVTGDGSFRMGFAELATARGQGLPALIILLNNRALGMVRQWQGAQYDGRYYASDLADTVDYVALAEAFSCRGFRVDTARALEPTLKEALAQGGTAVVEIVISKDARAPVARRGANK